MGLILTFDLYNPGYPTQTGPPAKDYGGFPFVLILTNTNDIKNNITTTTTTTEDPTKEHNYETSQDKIIL